MKKRWYLLIFIFLILFWYGEKRKFYCMDNNKCITVWKTYNNTCYITSGKYYGLIKPSGNYIKTTNLNDVTFFWSDKLPNKIIIEGENLEINNNSKLETVFLKYSDNTEKYKSIIYKPHAEKHNDINEDANYMNLYIQESYATNRNGVRIE